MSKHPTKIVHEGKIVSINAESIEVEIVNKSACATCHARGVCGASEEQVRIIVVPQTLATATAGYKEGDNVRLVLSSSMGMKAVIFAYGLPLLVLLASILCFSACGLEQLYTGLLSLLSVAIYYIIFALFKDKLEKEFVFSIEP